MHVRMSLPRPRVDGVGRASLGWAGCVGILLLVGVALTGCNNRPPPPATGGGPTPPKGGTATDPNQHRTTPVLHPTHPVLPSLPLPDLTITDIKIEPAPIVRADGTRLLIRGMTYSIRVEVKNVGAAPLRGGTCVAAPYGCGGEGKTPNLLCFGGGGFETGQSQLSEPFFVTLRLDRGGSCGFEFTVDPDNVQAESDESPASNVRKLAFEVP